MKVEEELCPSPPSQEDDDDFDPFDLAFSPDEEDDLECCIRPGNKIRTTSIWFINYITRQFTQALVTL